VARAFSNDRLEHSPKGNRGRTANLSPQLSDVLRRLHVERKTETLRRGWPEVPRWVFCDEAGRPFKEERLEGAFKRALRAPAVPDHSSPHSLRHTYASLLLSAGVPPVYVQRQLGHASIRLTVDLYGKWPPIEDQGAVARLDDRGAEDGLGADAIGSKTVAAVGAGGWEGTISKADSARSGPTGPGWAPLSRTRAR
jgi:integrase